jgi:hypothetical protein
LNNSTIFPGNARILLEKLERIWIEEISDNTRMAWRRREGWLLDQRLTHWRRCGAKPQRIGIFKLRNSTGFFRTVMGIEFDDDSMEALFGSVEEKVKVRYLLILMTIAWRRFWKRFSLQ